MCRDTRCHLREARAGIPCCAVRARMKAGPAWQDDDLAEADGNRTRQRRSAALTGFEDRPATCKAPETSATRCHPLSSVPGQGGSIRQGVASGRNLLIAAVCRTRASTAGVGR